MRNIKFQNLRFFVTVYEERSISAAARKLNATQSGVSVQVRDLEDQLGLVLFDRVSTGVSPTDAGARIYNRALRILREVSRLGEDVADHKDQLTGEIRVGIMPTFARAVLAPTLSAFSRANPKVRVKVTEGYSAVLSQMVLAGDLDVAVVPDGAVTNGLRRTFLDTDLELLVSHRPLKAATGTVDLSKIEPLNLILPSRNNARREKIDQGLSNFSSVVHSVLEVDSMMTTLDMIRGGEWCSILPGCLCLPDLNNPDINLYPIVRPNMVVDYVLVEPGTIAPSPAVRLFIEDISAEIKRGCETCRTHFGTPAP